MDRSYVPRYLVQHAPEDVSQSVLTLLLQKCRTASVVALPAQPAAGDVKALIAQHGYRMAAEVAKVADDPQVLAGLAKHSSVQVRRAVAERPNLDPETVDYLWRWACNKDEQDVLRSLASRVPFGVLLAQTPRHRFATEPGTYIAYRPCFSVADRLVAGPDRTAENLRAVVGCRSINEALTAVTMCAAGRFEDVSYTDALNLFVERQARHDDVVAVNGPDTYTALCLRHTLLEGSADGSARIDEELAGLVSEHSDRLVRLAPFNKHINDQGRSYRPRYGTSDLHPLQATASPEAARILQGTGNPALTNAFVKLANRSELRRELDAGNEYAAYWALSTRSRSLNSELANQALRLLRDNNTEPPVAALDLPARIVLDDGLLAGLVQACNGYEPDTLDRFVSGGFVQKPRPSMMGELLNGCWSGPPDLYETAHRERRIMYGFDRWRDKPWADDLIEALGPAIWEPAAPFDYVTERLFAEFGDHVELWSGCLGLLDPGFPGSLPELVDMVWAMFGDGLDRPDPTQDDPEPATAVDGPEQIRLFEVSSS